MTLIVNYHAEKEMKLPPAVNERDIIMTGWELIEEPYRRKGCAAQSKHFSSWLNLNACSKLSVIINNDGRGLAVNSLPGLLICICLIAGFCYQR